MRTATRSLVILLVVFLAVSAFSGCTTTTPDSTPGEQTSSTTDKPTTAPTEVFTPEVLEPITFSLLMGANPTWETGMDADPLGLWLTEQTGVFIECEIISGDTTEKYNLILATRDFPDFIMWDQDSVMNQFIDEGLLVSYDPYFDTIATNIYSQFKEAMPVIANLDDGKVYRVPQYYLGAPYIPSRGFEIRNDIVKQYYPDKADSKATLLLSEVESMFRDYKEKNPTTPEGATVYPMTDIEGAIEYYGRQIFGINFWWEIDDDTVSMYYSDPKMVDMIKWLNSWYREGLLDPEMFLNKSENANTKLSTGISIGILQHVAVTASANEALKADDPAMYLDFFRVAYEEGQDGYFAHSPFGGGGLCITTECKDIERAVSFVDFLCQPMVNFYVTNGLEGTFWEYDSNGKIVCKYDAVEAEPDFWQRYNMVGAYKYNWVQREGYDPRLGSAYDYGMVYEVIFGLCGDIDLASNGRLRNWESDDLFANYFQGIEVPAGSDEAIKKQQCEDIWTFAFPEMVMADSEEAAIAKYNETIAAMEEAGLRDYEAAVSVNYFKRKALVEQYS
jgi:putative aldouronate transport system substrate-binding protein